jgi:CRISPR-associated protein Cas5d
MNLANNEVAFNVFGRSACFTDPRFKIERNSYPVITRSAAKGILENIYWHPQIQWDITRIQVLNEIKYYGMTVNEVENLKASKDQPIIIKQRQQRSMQVLHDVSYNIYAKMNYVEGYDHSFVTKGIEIFKRRVKNGNYYHQPFLGVSNFMAYIDEVTNTTPHASLVDMRYLGIMLTDIHRRPVFNEDGKIVDYIHTPQFDEVYMENGVLKYHVS